VTTKPSAKQVLIFPDDMKAVLKVAEGLQGLSLSLDAHYITGEIAVWDEDGDECIGYLNSPDGDSGDSQWIFTTERWQS
jgi:hypothetical protein